MNAKRCLHECCSAGTKKPFKKASQLALKYEKLKGR